MMEWTGRSASWVEGKPASWGGEQAGLMVWRTSQLPSVEGRTTSWGGEQVSLMGR
jgi:hypothetical protein